MRGLRYWGLVTVSLGMFAAAGCGENDLSKPPKIFYGRDVCEQCRMILEDERFVCAAVSADSRFLKFDDIGCLAAYEKERSGRFLRSWVRDANGGGWLEKEVARFVYARDLITPMGYGVAAFAVTENAVLFAKEKSGSLITWAELLTLIGKQNAFKSEELK